MIFRLMAACVSQCSSRDKASAASTVPFQVRKSFAVKSSPLISRILLVSHPDGCAVQQLYYCCKHFLFAERADIHIAGNPGPYSGQGLRKQNQTVIFRAVSYLNPIRVITILFSAPAITTGNLN